MATSVLPPGRPVDTGYLEELGKQAAQLSAVNGISLTEAAVRTLGTEKLSAEQVRRAVEHCNTVAVNQKFASLTGQSRIVHIDGGPADPVQVLEGLKSASAPTMVQIEALEYAGPPSYEKRASALPAYASDPNFGDLRDKLSAAHDELSSRMDASSFAMEEALDRLKAASRSAALDGASLVELYSAWATVQPHMAKVAAAQLKSELPWGQKVAGRRISANSPVMTRFAEFAKVAAQYHHESQARMSVERDLTRVSNHLRRTAS